MKKRISLISLAALSVSLSATAYATDYPSFQFNIVNKTKSPFTVVNYIKPSPYNPDHQIDGVTMGPINPNDSYKDWYPPDMVQKFAESGPYTSFTYALLAFNNDNSSANYSESCTMTSQSFNVLGHSQVVTVTVTGGPDNYQCAWQYN